MSRARTLCRPHTQRRLCRVALAYCLLREMQRKGHDVAVADTGVILQDAIKMYMRLGFTIAKRLGGWVKLLKP